MLSEAEINWTVLRNIIERDAARWQTLADRTSYPGIRMQYLGRIEAARRTLESMCTLEFGSELTLSFPPDTMITADLLAEHTAAACQTIAETAEPEPAGVLGREYVWLCGQRYSRCQSTLFGGDVQCGHELGHDGKHHSGHNYWTNSEADTAAACDTIKAATNG